MAPDLPLSTTRILLKFCAGLSSADRIGGARIFHHVHNAAWREKVNMINVGQALLAFLGEVNGFPVG